MTGDRAAGISQAPIDDPPRIGRSLAIGGALAFLVLVTFWPATEAGFVDFDDDYYVTAAPWLEEGLTPAGVLGSFGRIYASNWHPLTVISHMVDAELFGLDPWGHHLVSVLWHAANALLLFLVLRAITGSTWKSALVAALFALHPLRVESVAWVSERKDVLSTFFALLTIGVYYRYSKTPSIRTYLPVVFSFLLALMSKAMVVTLPCVLLLLDLWPLRRFELERNGRFLPGRGLVRPLMRLVAEKIPLLALSAAVSLATVKAQGGALAAGHLAGGSSAPSAGLRLANAIDAYLAYLLDTFWPTGLACYYPFPTEIPFARTLVGLVVVALVTAVAIAALRRRPALLVGWLWFLGTLVPVIGLLQVGQQARADRYTYLPSIGLLVALVWGLDWLLERLDARSPKIRLAAAVVALVCLVALAGVSRAQIEHWKSSERLWTRALEVTENNYLAHLNLAEVLRAEGRRADAEVHYREVPRIRPDLAVGHGALGNALLRWGEPGEAIGYFERAIAIDSTDPRSYLGLVECLEALGRDGEIEAALSKAIASGAGIAPIRLKLAAELEARGDLEGAIENLRLVLRYPPYRPDLHGRLALLLDREGKLDQAAAELTKILERYPRAASAHRHLGSIRQRQGDLAAAREHLGTAFANRPDPELARALAGVLLELGDPATAESVLRVARERFPEDPSLSAALDALTGTATVPSATLGDP